jgi:hypothetical protein
VCVCVCVLVCSGAKGGKNGTKTRLDAEAARDAEKDTLAFQAGEESLIRWGKKISEAGKLDGRRYYAIWQCLYKVNGVQCQWKGRKEHRALEETLNGPYMREEQKHEGARS